MGYRNVVKHSKVFNIASTGVNAPAHNACLCACACACACLCLCLCLCLCACLCLYSLSV